VLTTRQQALPGPHEVRRLEATHDDNLVGTSAVGDEHHPGWGNEHEKRPVPGRARAPLDDAPTAVGVDGLRRRQRTAIASMGVVLHGADGS